MNGLDLRSVLTDRLEAEQPPPPDLSRVAAGGRAVRRRRRFTVGGAALATAGVVVASAVAIGGGDPRPSARDDDAAMGPMNFAEGVRAYADFGRVIHLGGKSFTWDEAYSYVDTDAAATPYGIVFFDGGRPKLLDESGTVSALVDGPVDDVPNFHPTAKADAQRPLVAWATLRGTTATVTVRNMATGEDVGSTPAQVDCTATPRASWEPGGEVCPLVIDAIDDGVVFVRTADGTRTWDSATDTWRDFAGPRTAVADVRSGVVLHDGPPPTDAGRWRLVRGAIDSQLSFDGEYVLGWSSRLESTTGGPAVELEQGSTDNGGPSFWTFDTDGSVLVATAASGSGFTVYDCELPSGACAELGPLEATGGDPMFIGNDM